MGLEGPSKHLIQHVRVPPKVGWTPLGCIPTLGLGETIGVGLGLGH